MEVRLGWSGSSGRRTNGERVERSKARTVFQICGNWRMGREREREMKKVKLNDVVLLVATRERDV
ncbi:hypothetical protein TSUD_305950 [Trifolium subterraneum]|uniref:Uncharacterized protein n=1 Tax=Trifolium subterraneum TaxID=3900 RepID=A0A2Z6N269_TRISU|nr:hypothetical protein TSUD_305950 [Trifolium subterraneum]